MIGTKTFKLGSVLVIQPKYLRFLNCFTFPSPRSSKFPVDISVLSQHSHRKRFMGNFYVEIKVLSQINCCQHKKNWFSPRFWFGKIHWSIGSWMHLIFESASMSFQVFKFKWVPFTFIQTFRLILNFKKSGLIEITMN